MLRLNTPAQADQLLSRLESEATRIKETMFAVKSHRNTLVPIGRLPPELLAEIFYELVCLYDEHPSHSKQHQSPFYWLYVTCVCSAWRRVAFSAPRVWSHIHIHPKPGDQERITTFFARSRSAPLIIKQRNPKLELPSMIIEAILGALDRTQSLSIILSTKVIKYTERGAFTLHAPELRDLTVHTLSLPLSKTSFPTIANASWPALRYLNCVGGPLSIVQALTRPTLVDLTVTCSRDAQSPTISWVNLLRELPALENLALIEVIAAPDVPVHVIPKSSRNVTLPQLRHLNFIDNRQGVSCADLLNHLVIPAKTSVSLHASGIGTREDYDFVVDALAGKASGKGTIGGQSAPALGIIFDESWINSLRIDIFTTEVASTLTERDGREIPEFDEAVPQHQIVFMWDTPEVADAQVQAFAAAYPLTQVRALSMRLSLARVREDMWRALVRMSNVDDIAFEFSQESAVAFFAFMAQDPAAFPKLDRLFFRGIQWNTRHRNKRRREARADSLMLRLVELLEERKARGEGLPLLDIAFCSHMGVQDGFTKDMRRLRAVVGRIELGEGAESEGECWTCSAASSEDASDEDKDASDEDEDASDEDEGASDEDEDASDEDEDASDEEEDVSDEEDEGEQEEDVEFEEGEQDGDVHDEEGE